MGFFVLLMMQVGGNSDGACAECVPFYDHPTQTWTYDPVVDVIAFPWPWLLLQQYGVVVHRL